MAVQFQDYYSLLGVPRTATEKEIRSAYRKLARKHHPDVNPGNTEAEDRFKRINEAHEVLSDAEKRAKYDQLGEHWKDDEQAHRGGGAGGGVRYEYRSTGDDDLRDMFGDEAPFSDFFETFFGSSQGGRSTGGRGAGGGGAGRTRRPRAGSDLEHPLDLSLADAYKGTTVTLAIQGEDGVTRQIEVKVPPGVRTGSRIRVAGKGGAGTAGGASGDLYLIVRLKADPRFELRGDDLSTDVRVPYTTMLLGGEAHVTTPDGRTLALSIPAATQDGRTFRLRGQGMPRLGRAPAKGDLRASVHARMPERLSARERELIEELVGAGTGTTGAGTAGAAGAGTR